MNKGFSLIELIVVIIILTIGIGILGPVIKIGIDSWVFARDQKEVLADATACMNRIVAELRGANQIGSCGGSCSAASIDFTKTNNTTNAFRTYNTSPNIYIRKDSFDCTVGSSYQLNNNPASLAFTYFKLDGTAASSCSEVRIIRVTLTITKGGRSYIFQTAVRPLGIP